MAYTQTDSPKPYREHQWQVVGQPGGYREAFKICAACGLRTELQHPPASNCTSQPATGSRVWWLTVEPNGEAVVLEEPFVGSDDPFSNPLLRDYHP